MPKGIEDASKGTIIYNGVKIPLAEPLTPSPYFQDRLT